MQLVHFDFNSTPFELHDDNYVLKAMEFGDRPQSSTVTPNVTDVGEGSSMSGMHQSQVPPSASSVSIRPPTSPPLPGILKARVKQEH
ncbi:transcription factor-like protein DPB-like [Trifolium medium]|uniref:Transcription factor-like protein DPB-like n=1 Tax=Trifolium medium TaxID=97028 RepID=A0A392NQQ3_9FABA|nr:transcription factor-like protein DPB-like [Trifolium medium]